MRRTCRLTALAVALAGLVLALWPRWAVQTGPDGSGWWGLGAPDVWFRRDFTSAGFQIGVDFITLSAAAGLIGLIALAYAIAPRKRRGPAIDNRSS